MAIYDCFTFYDEIELLEWRLRMLAGVVDCFVIVEANRSFQNREKPFNLEKYRDRLAVYWDKIRYLKITEEIPYTDDWSIEIYQRNYIANGLKDCQADDVIIIGDVDEIPDPRVLRQMQQSLVPVHMFRTFGQVDERSGLRGLSRNSRCFFRALPYVCDRHSLDKFLDKSAVVCEQRMFEFFVNYECPFHWCGTILCRYKNFTTPQTLRKQRNVLPMINGGWHFSSLGGVQAIKRKMHTTSDGMRNPALRLPENEQDDFIAAELERGRIWWLNKNLVKHGEDTLDIPEYEWFVNKYPAMRG